MHKMNQKDFNLNNYQKGKESVIYYFYIKKQCKICIASSDKDLFFKHDL